MVSLSRANRRVRVAGPDRHPCTPIAREQPVSGFGAWAAGGIIGKVLGRSARPAIDETLDGAPSRLDRIGALEQGGIADQTIVDQRLVADGCRRFAKRPVNQNHFPPPHRRFRTLPLSPQTPPPSLILSPTQPP